MFWPLVGDPRRPLRDPGEWAAFREPFFMFEFIFLSLRVSFWRMRGASGTLFTLSPSRSATARLRHVAVAKGRSFLSLRCPGRLITPIGVTSAVHDGTLHSKTKFGCERPGSVETVTDFYCYQFWQMLFFFSFREASRRSRFLRAVIDYVVSCR